MRLALRTLFVAIACALPLGACGGSSGTSGTSGTASGAKASGIRFADCMRTHGIPNFPDPSGGGGGIQIPIGSGIKPFSPAFKSAQQACAKLLPFGGPTRGGTSPARKAQLLRLAECMRSHGLTSFPDPTSGPPSLPPSGGGFGFGSPGAFLSVPGSVVNQPAFQTAAKACGFPGVGKPPPGAGGQ